MQKTPRWLQSVIKASELPLPALSALRPPRKAS